MNAHELNRRRLARLPFYLVPWTGELATEDGEGGGPSEEKPNHRLAIGVSAYCLVRHAAPPKQVHLPITIINFKGCRC